MKSPFPGLTATCLGKFRMPLPGYKVLHTVEPDAIINPVFDSVKILLSGLPLIIYMEAEDNIRLEVL